ncbi:MAG TPA: F0F1 ATP synthase subunit epsilon [Candidatus Saccharimonadales bacterium]|nr:F0F1 ATP synthase subunit epsilon [Candidatus Saccharimonadales bacterium]
MSADGRRPSASSVERVIGRQPVKRSKHEREADRAAGDYRKATGNDKLTMRVRVYSPFRDYYDGAAFSISAVNATGPFDILPRHHNFISLLSGGELVIRPTSGGEQKIVISGGIMHVKADQVIVFLDV